MEKLTEALTFAAQCHEGQKRKMKNIPYILHPMEVAAIISTMTDNVDVMIAGLLHDTIEDCNADPEEIKRRFGVRVSALVQSESEDKLSDRPPAETWMERKEDSLLFLRQTEELDVKILWLADKLANMRSFYRAHCEIGDQVWQGLHQKDPAMQEWYYRTIASLMPELADTHAYKEYVELIDKTFAKKEN